MPLVEAIATGLICSVGGGSLVALINGRAQRLAASTNAQASKAVADTNALAQIEAKRTLDATQLELDSSKRDKEYTDNLRADNERLNARLDALTKRVDELWAKLNVAQQQITDNHAEITTLQQENSGLRDKLKSIQQEYEENARTGNDRCVDLQTKYNKAQAKVDMLTRQLAKCKCGANQPPIEIGGSNVVINVEPSSLPVPSAITA